MNFVVLSAIFFFKPFKLRKNIDAIYAFYADFVDLQIKGEKKNICDSFVIDRGCIPPHPPFQKENQTWFMEWL
jgi:hypothetical protein